MHPNDMTYWDQIACQVKHGEHQTRRVDVALGRHRSYADLTSIPERFHRDLALDVWEWPKYMDSDGYCPGRDVVSQTIAELGVWEPCETTVLLLCFEALGFDGWFVDFGSQLGWYSTIAAACGMNVMAFDADPECVELTRHNMERGRRTDEGHLHYLASTQVRLGREQLSFALDPRHHLYDKRVVAKIDVEGAEPEAVAALDPISDLIDYMLVEISPVFHDGYPRLVDVLVRAGFEPYEMPHKHRPAHQLDQLSDLRPWHLDERLRAGIAAWHQRNVLFVRGGL